MYVWYTWFRCFVNSTCDVLEMSECSERCWWSMCLAWGGVGGEGVSV